MTPTIFDIETMAKDLRIGSIRYDLRSGRRGEVVRVSRDTATLRFDDGTALRIARRNIGHYHAGFRCPKTAEAWNPELLIFRRFPLDRPLPEGWIWYA